MDARHEALEQSIVNELIEIMNHTMRERTEALLSNKALCDDIKAIATVIYHYAQMWVDVEGVISKQNVLSTDVVLLPMVITISTPEISFTQVMESIASVIEKKSGSDVFYHDIQAILNKYDTALLQK
jgi:hypothetical protein